MTFLEFIMNFFLLSYCLIWKKKNPFRILFLEKWENRKFASSAFSLFWKKKSSYFTFTLLCFHLFFKFNLCSLPRSAFDLKLFFLSFMMCCPSSWCTGLSSELIFGTRIFGLFNQNGLIDWFKGKWVIGIHAWISSFSKFFIHN